MDETLTGDMEALAELTDRIHRARDVAAFGIVTGRTLDKALAVLDDLGLWVPDILITASGTELYYGTRLVRDRSWERQILHRWDPEAVRAALDEVPGMVLAPDEDQTHLRIRYLWDPDEAPDVAALRTRLRQAGLQANPMLDRQTHLDITPGRATPGLAIRFLCFKWNLPPERLLVAGDSGNDADMLSGETLGVVVGNHTAELDDLRGHPRVRFVEGRHAAGILDGIEHYDFFGTIRPGSPDDA
jgi:sucrose-phosphate synthase